MELSQNQHLLYANSFVCELRNKTIEFCSFTWNTPIERRIISSANSFSFLLRWHFFFMRETKRHLLGLWNGCEWWRCSWYCKNFEAAIDIDRNIAFNLASVAWMRQFFSHVWNTTSCACAHTATFFFSSLFSIAQFIESWTVLNVYAWKTHVSRAHFECCSIRHTDTDTHMHHGHTIVRGKFQSINVRRTFDW